jgi:hypothetical protein
LVNYLLFFVTFWFHFYETFGAKRCFIHTNHLILADIDDLTFTQKTKLIQIIVGYLQNVVNQQNTNSPTTKNNPSKTCFLKRTTLPHKPKQQKHLKKQKIYSNTTVTPCIDQTLHHTTPKYASQPNIAQTLH